MTVKVMIPTSAWATSTGISTTSVAVSSAWVMRKACRLSLPMFRRLSCSVNAAELRSMTAAQGSFEMDFSRYEIVPANVAQKVIAAAGSRGNED